MQNEEILRAAGFVRNPQRELWFSHEQHKIFSHEVLRDHGSNWLERALLEHVPEGEFRFYRNTSDMKTCCEILNEMGLADIVPVESLT